jgi:hypothetical protein
LPANACDAHVHLIGDDFPLWTDRVENPPPGTLDTWLDRYRVHLGVLGVHARRDRAVDPLWRRQQHHA